MTSPAPTDVIDNPPPEVVPVCDRAKADGTPCGEPGVFTYFWEWGEKGTCCVQHQFLQNQIAAQIGRGVQYAPLVMPGPAPITLDERTRLMGEV